jgi:hypothetical protein
MEGFLRSEWRFGLVVYHPEEESPTKELFRVKIAHGPNRVEVRQSSLSYGLLLSVAGHSVRAIISGCRVPGRFGAAMKSSAFEMR